MGATVLDALGPMPAVDVTFDFETYYSSTYQLKKMTTESYVRDPRFEVIGVGVKVGPRPSVWMEERDFRAWTRRVDWSRVSLLAHHSHFDGLVLSHHYGCRPRFWRCTLSMARALHGPGQPADLGSLAIRYGVGVKGDEVKNALGKRRRDFTAEEWLRYGVYGNGDVDLTARIYGAMSRVFPVAELWLIDMTVKMFTDPVLCANEALLDQAVKEEAAKKRAVLLDIVQTARINLSEKDRADEAKIAAAAGKVLRSNEKLAALLRDHGIEPKRKPGKPAKDGTPTLTYAFAKADPFMQGLLEHPVPEVQAIAEARIEVKSTIVGTRTQRFRDTCRRGRMPVYLKYAGAHTQRWAGGDKMNWQNMNRGGVLRDAIEAAPGCVIVVADSGQIEARGVSWLAGQTTLLDTFRRNDALGKKGDFYSEEGSRFYQRKLSKEETPRERQVSKALLLGLGYQMGWPKCAAELLKGMLGTPPVQFTAKDAALFGVNVAGFERSNHGRDKTCGTAVAEMISDGARLTYAALLVHSACTAHLVNLYRKTNTMIPKCWNALQDFLPLMAEPGDASEVRARFGALRIVRHGIIRPSGLALRYHGLRRQGAEFVCLGGDSGREWVKLYGGKMTENAVQALARDIVAEQALYVHAAGFRVVTTTHDEIVCMVPEADGQRCLDYMLARMKIPPAWCLDIPLNASGGYAKTYGAAKKD